MAVVTATSTERPRVADYSLRKFELDNVADADTFEMPAGIHIIAALFIPTTAVAVGTSISGSTITFAVAAGTPDGDLLVWVG